MNKSVYRNVPWFPWKKVPRKVDFCKLNYQNILLKHQISRGPNEEIEWILFLFATTKSGVWILAGDEILSILLTLASRVHYIRTLTRSQKQHGGPFFVDKCLWTPRTFYATSHIFHAVSEAFLCSVAYSNHKSAGTPVRLKDRRGLIKITAG